MKANDSTGLMDRQDVCPTGSTGFQPVLPRKKELLIKHTFTSH